MTTQETADARLASVVARIERGESLAGLDLNGLTITGTDLPSNAALDFTGASLRGAMFAAAELSGARFVEADLSGASFHRVNLMRADFRRSAGRGSIFTDVNLAYANFQESDLCGALFFNVNMADISFKGASLDGSEVDAIRLSLNGSTHVLGLKEALRSLGRQESYPYIAGVSGDAFWVSYFLKTRDINWGGFTKDVLRRGLENFGYGCSFIDEVEPADAWEALKGALAGGSTVITPLHVSASTVRGTGFGGSEWVFVTGIDRGDVLVNCLLGDGLRFTPERFKAGWCQHHPLEEAADDLPVIYAMCVVGAREHTPSRVEMTRAGLRAAVEVLTLPGTERIVFGFDAYQQMLEDLQGNRSPRDMPPDEARRHLPWLGLGVMHHHGSRWAIRDFLSEVLDRGEFSGEDQAALREAHDLYGGVCADLQAFLEKMPWSFDTLDEDERLDAYRRFDDQREAAADLLRSSAARERDALERFRAVLEPR